MDDDDAAPPSTRRAEDAASTAARAIETSFTRAAASIEASLARAARTGEIAFDDMARRVAQSLAGLAIEKIVDGTLARAAGGAAEAAGARADGGPVTPGAAYLVGERGPELFRPAAAGAIEPLEAGHVSVHFHLAAGADPSALQRSQGQIAALVARAVEQGRRRL